MTNKEKDAIEYISELDKTKIFYNNPPSYNNLSMGGAIEIALNLIEKQQAEIEKKDKTVKHIIERLENDIKRITETKTKKSEHYLDDYTRNRLKAYKTKTKEIKEYIEEQYFERRIEQ